MNNALVKNNKQPTTLKRQFTVRILVLMVLVAAISGTIQLVMANKSTEKNVAKEAESISASIQHGIDGTELAANEIEHQIDLKMESYSKYIAKQLNNKPVSSITTEELEELKAELGVSGITLFQQIEDDLVGVRATDQEELGFSMNKANPQGYQVLDSFMEGTILDEMKQAVSYITDRTTVLYTTQSGSHEDPMFFKYAYYHQPDTDYLINPYIEAEEVHQYVEKVGPESWIEEVMANNQYAEEIAVLNPAVFADPSLAEKVYPPLEKVENGTFALVDKQDEELLIDMLENPQEQSFTKTIDGEDIYKTFFPVGDGRVIYVALNYGEMKAPFYKQSLIFVLASIVALIALVLLTTSFFNKIYGNIQKIISQIRQLEKGDFTAQSTLNDQGELGSLSTSANKMASSLNLVLSETREQAKQTEKLSYMLESEADNSVEKVYTISMEATTTSREAMTEVDDFLNEVKEVLQTIDTPQAREILDRLDDFRQLSKDRAASTTDITITLADLLKSLHGQSAALSAISRKLLDNLKVFQLEENQKTEE
ncbi:methyl-accepting chemotaxis protein [Virgibacillus senegalensis]|uniref:methyl-accepting chemotaxis protein n=1 Tax=Virgibacillus senegalensis TaxID=1499679 RepID=UPI00069E8A46|nr:methyl-accepting chemotaxis protein [Virgibacillus senegalensis]